ncbi:MAG TPA: GGDEF and EAL domain-containing protein, partial [Campylobacterales bacterium]|nr:GGDEF and EAL domain-containing protein [Campylobacterales bacterium]
KYLYIALSIAVILFQFVTYNNSSWNEHQELIMMMTVGLIGLPLLFSHILNQVSSLNDALVVKSDDLEQRLYHDSMTGLKNREALKQELNQNDFYALTLIDINNFGNFNDLYGIEVGNEILINLAKFLTKIAYKHHLIVYRLSGDSFILLQKEPISSEAFEEKMQTIINALDVCKMSITLLKLKIKVNFTIVTVKAQEKALEKASMTLHFARKRGERYWVYDESINRQDEVENILFWEKEIYDAIVEDRIVPVFHPIVDIDGKIVKYEVLMRMKRKEAGKMKLSSPYEFLEIAVKTNQYEKLTTIMIEKSFAAMSSKECDFSINLTFSNIQNKNMVMFLKSKIDEYKLGDRLILEIVESEDIYNFEIVKTFVAYLRLLGVRFAIDDFGSGYSNYMHVFEVMPEFIKLDGSLIQNIDRDDNAYKFVSSIVLLARNLGIKTIAEFVHNEKIFQITKNIGIDEFQGSFFSKPLTTKQLQDKKR